MRLEHGEHNEGLCDHLLTFDNGKYNDWVVTTAFYACIHFVEHKLFPCQLGGLNYDNFDEYCGYQHNEQYNNLSKHSLKERLVNQKYQV